MQVTDPQGRRNLGGNVNIRNFNLAMVNPIFTRGEKAAGMVSANLRLGGDVQSPQLLVSSSYGCGYRWQLYAV